MTVPQATYADADIIMKLYDMRREERLRKARDWFVREFNASTLAEALEKYPPGSDPNAFYRMVGTYWDMAASFVANGIVHEELFFQNNGELLIVWEKLKDMVTDMRKVRKNPMAYRNLERVAAKHVDWMNRNAPGSYEALMQVFKPKK